MRKKTFPTFVPPMMAQSAKEPFDSPDWIFEIKLDGYRAITVFDAAGKPYLWPRNGLPLEQKFSRHFTVGCSAATSLYHSRRRDYCRG
jgi:ATP-dependent DNA ligase